MNVHTALLVLLAPAFTVGCAGMMQGGGSDSGYETPEESKTALRDGEKKAYSASAAAMDERMDKLEADAAKAMKLALGQEAISPGQPNPRKVSESVLELRKAKIDLRLEKVLDQNGKPVNNDFLTLKDSYTDKVPALSRKIGEKKATPAEIKFVQEGAQHMTKINDLRMQIMNASMATMMANDHVQSSALTTMLQVAQMQRSRKQMDMDLNDEDIEQVRGALARHRRAEAVAASTLGLMAAYQAVLNDKRDPKGLEMIAETTLKAFPGKPEVSADEARAYVKNLKGNVAAVKTQYVKMMVEVHGQEKYDQQYKAGIDAMFRQAETAEDAKSGAEIAKEHYEQWKKDNPELAAKQAGGASGLSLGMLGSMFPAVAVIEASLVGLEALANGDPKAALDAAIGMAPGSELVKGGLSEASNLLFG